MNTLRDQRVFRNFFLRKKIKKIKKKRRKRKKTRRKRKRKKKKRDISEFLHRVKKKKN